MITVQSRFSKSRLSEVPFRPRRCAVVRVVSTPHLVVSMFGTDFRLSAHHFAHRFRNFYGETRKSPETSVTVVGVLAKIQTVSVLNTGQNRYGLSQLAALIECFSTELTSIIRP
jgi:hypothetical protein